MRKINKKIEKYKKQIFYLIVFLLGFLFYTFGSFIVFKNSENYLEVFNESKLPRIYIKVGEEKINQLRAYKIDTIDGVYNETITMIPQNRNLDIFIYDLNVSLKNLEYEVRDKYTKTLVERTNLTYIEEMGDCYKATLRIQNIIGKEQEYNLRIEMDVGEEKLYYWTTIIWLNDNNKIEEMINLAKDFVVKSFSEKTATSLISYMENNANSDENQLNEITLASKYEQITWAERDGLQMSLASDIEYSIIDAKAYAVVMNAEYITSCVNDKGITELFFNKNEYVFRTIDNKILVMKYKRQTEEYLNIDNVSFNSKKLYFGITNRDTLKEKISENRQYNAFIKAKELFVYDYEDNILTKIFSFRENKKNNFKNIYNKYDMKILKVNNNGDVNFIVYGYQNRGKNEGQIGVAVYTYNMHSNEVIENFFLPIHTFFEDIKYDIDRLTYLNDKNVLTMYILGTIYNIDVSSKDVMTLVSDLNDEDISVSKNEQFVSYLEYSEGVANNIVVLNNVNNTLQSIKVLENQFVQQVGFLDDDLCYGIGNIGDTWNTHGREIIDMSHTLKFFNVNTGENRSYVDEGCYFQFFEMLNNRIKYKKFMKADNEDNNFIYIKEDVIINAQHIDELKTEFIRNEIKKPKKRVYYLSINLKDNDTIKTRINSKIYINSADLNSITNTLKKTYFYALSNGRLLSRNIFLTQAISKCKDDFGYIRYKGRTIWNRSNKPSYMFLAVPIRENVDYSKDVSKLKNRIVETEDFLIIDAILMNANELEYYVAQNMPVLIYLQDGSEYLLISYNGKNYRTYDLKTQMRKEWTYKEVEDMLNDNSYNAVCALGKSRY